MAIYAPRFIIPDTTNIDTLRFSAPTQQERDDSQANNTPLPPQFGAFHNFALGLGIDQKRTHWGLYGFGGYGPIFQRRPSSCRSRGAARACPPRPPHHPHARRGKLTCSSSRRKAS